MIRVVQGELAQADTAAILRPVSAEWEPVTPATRRLEIAAGKALIEQCEKLGDLPVGSAVITSAGDLPAEFIDRKSTRLNSSHSQISYVVFRLKKKKHRE